MVDQKYKDLFNSYDEDKDGEVNILTLAKRTEQDGFHYHTIFHTFNCYDTDNKGTLNVIQYANAMKTLTEDFNENLDKSELIDESESTKNLAYLMNRRNR